jgi:hypothetical protein
VKIQVFEIDLYRIRRNPSANGVSPAQA